MDAESLPCDTEVSASTEGFVCSQFERYNLNNVFKMFNLSPVNLLNYHLSDKKNLAKRKMAEISSQTSKKLKKVLHFEEDFEKKDYPLLDMQDIGFKNLLQELKDKFHTSSREVKIQILTMFVGNFEKNEVLL